MGGYKPTYNWGAPSCVIFCVFLFFFPPEISDENMMENMSFCQLPVVKRVRLYTDVSSIMLLFTNDQQCRMSTCQIWVFLCWWNLSCMKSDLIWCFFFCGRSWQFFLGMRTLEKVMVYGGRKEIMVRPEGKNICICHCLKYDVGMV